MGRKRGFGQLSKLPSKRWRARYTGPDEGLHSAPHTFVAKADGEAWLVAERALISAGTWTPPKVRAEEAKRPKAGPVTFGAYASAWLAQRDLKPRTRSHYSTILDTVLVPEFGTTPLREITPAAVRVWHAAVLPDRPTYRSHAYSLLRTILGTAVTDGEIAANPCVIRGAGTAKRAKVIRPASLEELEAIVHATPERYRAMILLAAWCALRFGELAELRRRDLDLERGIVRVRRAAVRVDGEVLIGTPKTEAGVRDVHIPPHLIPLLAEHLQAHVDAGPDALLFPARHGGTMAPSTLYRVWYPAREAAGRSDLRFHELRHTGAVLAAQTGATLAELMARLGHSTPQAAMIYQHASRERDAAVAEALSRLASGGR